MDHYTLILGRFLDFRISPDLYNLSFVRDLRVAGLGIQRWVFAVDARCGFVA